MSIITPKTFSKLVNLKLGLCFKCMVSTRFFKYLVLSHPTLFSWLPWLPASPAGSQFSWCRRSRRTHSAMSLHPVCHRMRHRVCSLVWHQGVGGMWQHVCTESKHEKCPNSHRKGKDVLHSYTFSLKALLNNVSTFKKSELHGCTWYQCL